MITFALSIISHNRLKQMESVFFSFIVGCRFYFQIIKKRGRNSCRCFCVELVKLLPDHRYSVNIFFIIWSFRSVGFWQKAEYCFSQCQGHATVLLHFPLFLINRLYKTESAVSLYCRFSLFLYRLFKIQTQEQSDLFRITQSNH